MSGYGLILALIGALGGEAFASKGGLVFGLLCAQVRAIAEKYLELVRNIKQ